MVQPCLRAEIGVLHWPQLSVPARRRGPQQKQCMQLPKNTCRMVVAFADDLPGSFLKLSVRSDCILQGRCLWRGVIFVFCSGGDGSSLTYRPACLGLKGPNNKKRPNTAKKKKTGSQGLGGNGAPCSGSVDRNLESLHFTTQRCAEGHGGPACSSTSRAQGHAT